MNSNLNPSVGGADETRAAKLCAQNSGESCAGADGVEYSHIAHIGHKTEAGRTRPAPALDVAAGDEAEPAKPSKSEKRREQQRQWREKNKAHIKAWSHRYYLNNRAAIIAATRRWAQAYPDKKRAYMAEWRRRNPDKIKAWRKKFSAAQKMYQWTWWQKVDAKCRSDADYYAKFRAAQRLSAAKCRAKKKGLDLSRYGWKPGPRIPDWARKGEVVVDAASVYLWNNRSADELVAARAFNMKGVR